MNSSQPHDLDAVRRHLLPRLRLPQGGASLELVPGLIDIGLIREDETGWHELDTVELLRLSTTVAELLPHALRNLRIRSSPEAWMPVETVPGMELYYAEDGQAAARLLVLQDLFPELPVGGILVAVPSPDQLLAVPLESVDSLQAMQVMLTAAIQAHGDSETPLSDQAFWFDGNRLHHLLVEQSGDDVQVTPPAALLARVEQLTALEMTTVVAEA